MNIRKALLPFIPSPVLRIYRKIKRYFVSERRKFKTTGTNVAEIKRIHLNEALMKEKHVDAVKILGYLNWDNPFNTNDYGKYQFLEKEYKIENNTEIELAFNNYGFWTLDVLYYRDNRIVTKEKRTIKVEAPEYNIAYLAATLPVLFFLFYLWKISGTKSPTILGLERVLFDYKALPENVFPFPLASEEDLNTAYKGFNKYAQRLVAYIGMLNKMNPDARFNLYLCDHQAYYALPLLYANRIPEKKFTVHLLSDGTGSYECFHHVFGLNGAEKLYADMQKTWTLAKQEAVTTGVQKWGEEVFCHCGDPCVAERVSSRNMVEELANRFAYSYVMTNTNNNYELILHNINLLRGNQKILDMMTDRVHNIDFEDGKKQFSKHIAELCKMIGIKYPPFEQSKKQGKKICILLGNFPYVEKDDKYISKTIEYWGTDYNYYLKDHPWVKDDRRRIETLKSKGITALDSKIPIEIFMMMDAKVYIAGYLSSSFLSIDLLDNPKEQILSIWDMENCRIKTNCLDFTAKTAMNVESDSVIVYDR